MSNGKSINIQKNITIYGSDDSKTVLDANGKSNILSISKNVNINLYGLTFVNGKTASNGGAINNDGNLIISNSSFINNTAYNYDKGRINGDGGAINNNGNLIISDSDFVKNYAYNGGAIRGSKDSKITADNCAFNENSATFGGSIDSYFSAVISMWFGLVLMDSTAPRSKHCTS